MTYRLNVNLSVAADGNYIEFNDNDGIEENTTSNRFSILTNNKQYDYVFSKEPQAIKHSPLIIPEVDDICNMLS